MTYHPDVKEYRGGDDSIFCVETTRTPLVRGELVCITIQEKEHTYPRVSVLFEDSEGGSTLQKIRIFRSSYDRFDYSELSVCGFMNGVIQSRESTFQFMKKDENMEMINFISHCAIHPTTEELKELFDRFCYEKAMEIFLRNISRDAVEAEEE